MATRICRHCGAEYRGLACPCRKRAWAAQRERDAKQTESAVQPAGLSGDRAAGEQPVCESSTGANGSATESIGPRL